MDKAVRFAWSRLEFNDGIVLDPGRSDFQLIEDICKHLDTFKRTVEDGARLIINLPLRCKRLGPEVLGRAVSIFGANSRVMVSSGGETFETPQFRGARSAPRRSLRSGAQTPRKKTHLGGQGSGRHSRPPTRKRSTVPMRARRQSWGLIDGDLHLVQLFTALLD